ncbi:MAG: alkylmercury lyase MerB [Burkholderiales bacterium]
MSRARPAVEVLSDRLLNVFPALDADDQRLSLALYRRLAEGSPVALSALAVELAMAGEEVERRLAAWPEVYYDGERRVIGYWGLTIRPMTHRLRVDGRELFAWCAWDTLFLPALLGRTAEVSSVCRGSGDPVRLSVSPREVESAEPEGIAVSFLVPDADAVRADVIASFCHYVHFFASADAAQPWLAQHPAAFLLSLDEAYEVGRLRTRARYPATLARH